MTKMRMNEFIKDAALVKVDEFEQLKVKNMEGSNAEYILREILEIN